MYPPFLKDTNKFRDACKIGLESFLRIFDYLFFGKDLILLNKVLSLPLPSSA